jgi:curved DNA-binding protein CbpA
LSKRALIIGSDKDYCFIIKEFLVLRELYVTVVLNYKEGIDRLFYEKPDLTILEITAQASVEDYINAIKKSHEFEIVDYCGDQELKKQSKAVLIFDDKSRINSLFDFLRKNYSNQKTEQPQDTEDEGSLGSAFYPSLLVDIYRKKRSGVLSITSNAELIIYFINGEPVFAEGGDIETAIGRILLDSGKISEDTYEKALDIATKHKQKFGQILFEMGISSPHELNSFLEYQIQEKILRGFYYLNGRYVFKSGDEFADRIVSYQVDLSRIIYEGIKRYIDVEGLEEQDPIIEIDPKLKSDINSLGLKPKELRFVQLLKERATVKEVLKTSRLDKPETLKLLYFLFLFKLINLPGIFPDAIGRASIEKRIVEKEAEGGVTKDESIVAEDAPRNARSADFEQKSNHDEGLYPIDGSKDTEAQVRTESEGASLGASPDRNETISEVEIPEIDRRENNTPFETAPGPHDKDQDIEITEAASESTSPQDDGDEQIFYIPEVREKAGAENQNPPPGGSPDSIVFSEPDEAETHLMTEENAKEFEIELELDNEPDKTDIDSTDSSTFAWEEGESIQPEGVSLEPELELDTDAIRYTVQEHTAPGNINDLLHPYTDTAGKEEAEAGETYDGKEMESIFTDQSSGPEAGSDAHDDSTEKSHPPAFDEQVSAFYSTLGQKDYYQILGVSQEATTEEIRDAYYKLVKFYHPDVNPNVSHEIKAKTQEIFTQITDAYETLSEADKREQYNSLEELAELKTQAKYIYEAEMVFKKGITLLIQRDYVEAEKKIREAVEMNPDDAAYLGAHAWARFLAAENKSAILEEVKKSLETAIKMNEKLPENYYYLGSVYKFTNDLRNAEKYYQKTLELDPDYIEAKREIRLINTRKTESKNDKKIEKNFWSAIFKK